MLRRCLLSHEFVFFCCAMNGSCIGLVFVDKIVFVLKEKQIEKHRWSVAMVRTTAPMVPIKQVISSPLSPAWYCCLCRRASCLSCTLLEALRVLKAGRQSGIGKEERARQTVTCSAFYRTHWPRCLSHEGATACPESTHKTTPPVNSELLNCRFQHELSTA